MRPRWRLLPDDPEIGWMPYVWLLYLSFVFLVPGLWNPTSEPAVWIASALATLVFVPLYFVGYWVHGAARLRVALAITAVGLALAPLNTGAGTFVVFASHFAAMWSERARAGLAALGLVLALTVLAALLVQPSVYFWSPALAGAFVIGLLGLAQVKRDRMTQDLRLARAEVDALARIAERERIARDLHDLLGQSLSVIALKAELAHRLLERDPARAAQEIEEVRVVARETLGEVRTAVRGYRVGSGCGLDKELADAQRALASADVELHIAAGPDVVARCLDATHEGVLALVLREATTNVIRHARARTCTVRFRAAAEAYDLEIRDDGRGLHAAAGHGLRGMRERVEALGGTLTVTGPPGTAVQVRFPVACSEVA
jgi:two-component system, NarL family, sensor histidine kinase DesK